MPTTRVKICGVTRPDDAALAAELGADAVGINLFRGPRKLDDDHAAAITRILPAFVTPVALTSTDVDDPSPFWITVDNRELRIHHVQLYGFPWFGEADLVEFCNYIPVFPIASRESFVDLAAAVAAAKRWFHPAAILVDTASEKLGGTGQSFNWHWIAEARDAGELANLPPLILAGGLTPDNVADAIRIARPYAVDVSSGVEVPNRPGIKDPIKLRDFIQAAKAAL